MTDLLALTADLPLRHVAAGEVLIDEGADGGTLYVLASGTCAIERDGVVFASVGHPGAVFGEMAVVLGKPVLSVPVRHQAEQELNAAWLDALGLGVYARRIDADTLGTFLARDWPTVRRDPRLYRGTADACVAVESALARAVAEAA